MVFPSRSERAPYRLTVTTARPIPQLSVVHCAQKLLLRVFGNCNKFCLIFFFYQEENVEKLVIEVQTIRTTFSSIFLLEASIAHTYRSRDGTHGYLRITSRGWREYRAKRTGKYCRKHITKRHGTCTYIDTRVSICKVHAKTKLAI